MRSTVMTDRSDDELVASAAALPLAGPWPRRSIPRAERRGRRRQVSTYFFLFSFVRDNLTNNNYSLESKD